MVTVLAASGQFFVFCPQVVPLVLTRSETVSVRPVCVKVILPVVGQTPTVRVFRPFLRVCLGACAAALLLLVLGAGPLLRTNQLTVYLRIRREGAEPSSVKVSAAQRPPLVTGTPALQPRLVIEGKQESRAV